ncbi:hypothetical protein [Anaerocolumna jejuensis]|uniref:hypothetical protein n=1 Tax=Anaerocolumna jejuensis TaxID=259063 RepID=UPI003F7BB6C0
MKRKNHKIRELASIILVTAIMIGGTYAILTAPTEKITDEQKQLQEDLNKNTVFLEQQKQSSLDAEKESSDVSSIPEQPLGNITAVGDSVMLGAAPEIQKVIPDCVIDAKESRQVWGTIELVNDLDAKGELGDTVIVALGTNGTFSESMGQKLLDAIGSKRTVYWVTAYGKSLYWQEDVNRMIERLVKKNKNLNIIDWASVASEHPEWFYDDGIHLNSEGQTGYANFIAKYI